MISIVPSFKLSTIGSQAFTVAAAAKIWNALTDNAVEASSVWQHLKTFFGFSDPSEYKLCMTVHRCLHGEAPRFLADLITPSAAATARAGLRSATSGPVAVSHTTSSLGDRSFAVAAPRAWNKLLSPLRRVHSMNTFKRQMKTLIFAQAFLIFKAFYPFIFNCILFSALVVFAILLTFVID